MEDLKPRILVVENDPDTAESYRLVLEGGGYEVRHAVTTAAAWQVADTWQPELILLEIMLPQGTEGLDFLWDLRRADHPLLARTPVMIVSGIHQGTGLRVTPQHHATPDDLELLPASGFLDKPLQPADLLGHVQQVFDNVRRGEFEFLTSGSNGHPAAPGDDDGVDREATDAPPLTVESPGDLGNTSAGAFLAESGSRYGKPVVSPELDLLEFRTPTGGTLVGPAEILRNRGATDLESALALSVPICSSWNYAVRREGGGYQATLENALGSLQLMAQMGFHFVEVEGYGRSGVTRLFEERRRVKQQLDEWGLQTLVYCFIDSGFAHVDFAKRARGALDRFQNLALPTAEVLGAEMVRVNSFTPSAARYVDPSAEAAEDSYHLWPPYSDEGLQTSELHLPADFELKPAWRALVAGCRIAAELAKQRGLPLVMEPRRRELCETIGDLINLCDEVDFSSFFVVLDTAHANYGEEFLVAARKLAELPKRSGRICCIHASDNDGGSYRHGTIGDYKGGGGIDWHQFAEFLKQPMFRGGRPFGGPLVVDCGSPGMEELEESIVVSARRLQEILTAHDIPWLI